MSTTGEGALRPQWMRRAAALPGRWAIKLQLNRAARRTRWAGALGAVMLATSCPGMAWAATQADARAKALSWMIQQQKGDGSWVDSAGQQSEATALFLDSMASSGINYGYVSGAASSWLLNQTHVNSVDALARQIIALGHMGANTAPSTAPLMSAHAAAETGSGGVLLWGPYPGWAATAIDTALAYEALLAAGDTLNTLNLQAAMNDLQRSDGGWSRGSVSSEHSAVIPTIQALHALSVYALKNPSKASAANAVMAGGLAWLLARQKSDGGYADDANSSGVYSASTPSQIFETAMAWNVIYLANRAGYAAAQTSAATAAQTAAQNLLLSKQATDGSWSEDALLTASVLTAWGTTGDSTATLADANHDGVPDAAQPYLWPSGTPTGQATARALPKGNGNGAPVVAVVASNGDAADAPALPFWGLLLEGASLVGVAWHGLIRRRRS